MLLLLLVVGWLVDWLVCAAGAMPQKATFYFFIFFDLFLFNFFAICKTMLSGVFREPVDRLRVVIAHVCGVSQSNVGGGFITTDLRFKRPSTKP